MFIRSAGKLKYINGKIHEPAEDGLSYDDWECGNLTVMSCLINSMEPSISVLKGQKKSGKLWQKYTCRRLI